MYVVLRKTGDVTEHTSYAGCIGDFLKCLRNWLLFLIVIFIWGIGWVVLKIGLSYVDPLNLTLHRFVIAALALTPLLIPLRRRIPKDWKSSIGLFLLGVLLASGVAMMAVGLTHEKSGISAVLTYTQPLFVFCMAVPLLKEKANASRFAGIFIGFIGVVILSLKDIGHIDSFTYPFFFLIASAFLWAVSVIYYKKFLSHIDPLVTNIFQLAWGAIILVPLSVSFGNFYFPISVTYLLIIMFASLATFCAAGTIWIFLLREEEATVLSFSSLIIPIIALFFGLLLLGENIELTSLIGVSLILGGLYLVNKKSNNFLHRTDRWEKLTDGSSKVIVKKAS